MIHRCFSSFFLSICLTFSLIAVSSTSKEAVNAPFCIGRITSATIINRVPEVEAFLSKRSIIKHSIYVAGIIAAVATFQGVIKYQVDTVAKVDADQLKRMREAVAAEAASAGVTTGLWSWIKSVPVATGSLFQSMVPLFLVNSLLGVAWERLQSSLAGPLENESLHWYYDNYTNIQDGIKAIKLNAAPLDKHSFYLSFETNQIAEKVILKKFMQDVRDVIHRGSTHSFLPLEVIGKYMRQSHYLDSLTDDALFIEGLKQSKQFMSDEDGADSEQKQFHRRIIYIFVDKLKNDIENLIAFAIAHHDQLSIENAILQQLIGFTNTYINYVEELLSLSDEELEVASLEKRGLFTKTFEFNKLFDDSFKTLNSRLIWGR